MAKSTKKEHPEKTTGRDLLNLLNKLAKEEPELLDLPLATHALNHTYSSGGDALWSNFRVVVLHHYTGDHLAMGDFSKRMVNHPNYYVTREVDGYKRIPDEWWKPGDSIDG
jgi:hypothetical protein